MGGIMRILRKCNFCQDYPRINSLYDITCGNFDYDCQQNRVITPILTARTDKVLYLKSITQWNQNVIKNSK